MSRDDVTLLSWPVPAAVYRSVFAPPFRALSQLRRDRSVHAQGVLCSGELHIERSHPLTAGAEVFTPGPPRPVIARFSRMIGLPQQVGDVFGLAVRLPDVYGPGAHQDLLCNSSLPVPPLQQVFLPAQRWFSQPYSSCLPVDARAGPFLYGWRPSEQRGPAPSIAAIASALDGGGVCFEVTVARRLGTFMSIGELRLVRTVPPVEDIVFDPIVNTGGGLVPTGTLNRARSAVYAASRAGRGEGTDPRAVVGLASD